MPKRYAWICTTLAVGMMHLVAGCTPAVMDGGDGPGDGSGDGSGEPSAPQWREAFDALDAGFLSSVWGSGPSDVFVVGGQPESSVIYHFDGASWDVMESPATPILIWVFGFGPDDVYAVGEQGTAMHYDGDSWSLMTTNTDVDLWGIWGAAPDDLWAVGGEIDGGTPLLMHFDGNVWEEREVPMLDRASTALLKVWGTSSQQIFAVGQTGVILEFDGQVWQQVFAGTSEDLVALWGTGPNDIVAVGGRSNGVVATYSGNEWTSQSVAPLPGLNGVFPLTVDDFLIGGLIGSVAVFDIDTGAIAAESTTTTMTIHAIWDDGAGTSYAVGGRSSQVPYEGVALMRSVVD